jgi:hypothetical protein
LECDRLMKNAHLPFDRLMALSKVEGRRYPHSAEFRVPCIWTFLISLQSRFQRTTDYGQLTTDSMLQIPRVANRDIL